jgi:hypothetical protein
MVRHGYVHVHEGNACGISRTTLFAGPANQIEFLSLFPSDPIPREAASGDSQSCISFHSPLITGAFGGFCALLIGSD